MIEGASLLWPLKYKLFEVFSGDKEKGRINGKGGNLGRVIIKIDSLITD